MSEIEILPTVVPQSLSDISALLERGRAFSRDFHIDAADGVLAPNKTWVPAIGEKLPEGEQMFYEAHLMVSHPGAVGSAFAAAGAKRIIAHAEAFDSAEEAEAAFSSWRKNGAEEFGIALLINTPLEALESYVLLCQSVTLMTIARVGTQGIPFDDRGYGRVADLHARYPDLLIEADGGVSETSIAALARAGVRRFSVGSAVAKAPDPAFAYRQLRSLAESAIQ